MKTGAWRNLTPPLRARAIRAFVPARRGRGVVDDDGATAEPRRDALARCHRRPRRPEASCGHARRRRPHRPETPPPARRRPRARALSIRCGSRPSPSRRVRSMPSTIALPSSPVPINATSAMCEPPATIYPRVRRLLTSPRLRQFLRSVLRWPSGLGPGAAGASLGRRSGRRRAVCRSRSGPTRSLVGFDVEIADLLAAGLGRTPEFLNITLRLDRPVDRPRRRRHRLERHRGHAGPARDDGRRRCRTTSSARC